MRLFKRRERDGVLVNMTGHGTAVARVGSPNETPELSAFEEIPAEDEGGLQRWVEREFPTRSNAYLACYAGFSPPDRILERELINGKRVMDWTYVHGLLNQRHPTASPADWQIAFLDTNTGIPLQPDPSSRPGLFFGMPLAEISSTQRKLTEIGLRTQRLELGILPLIGGLLRWQSVTAYPHRIAICEIGPSQTRIYILAKDGIHTPPPVPHGLTSIAEAAMKELSAPDIIAARVAMRTPTEELLKHAKKHVRMLTKHLRPSIDFFEMQTGLRVGGLFCSHLPSGYRWLERAIAPSLDLEDVAPDPASWEATLGVKITAPVPLQDSWFQTVCLVGKLEAARTQE